MSTIDDQRTSGKWRWLGWLKVLRLKGGRLLQFKAVVSVAESHCGNTAIISPVHTPGDEFSAYERGLMLDLARQSVTSAATSQDSPSPKDYPDSLERNRACFVTLTKGGALRGCVGNLAPQTPLHKAIVDNARSAARRDPRFPPIEVAELPELRVEISVLTEPEWISFSSEEELLEKINPLEHGVTLRIGHQLATFLPQVWALIKDKAEFLDQLSQKAGCQRGAWRGKDVSVSVYRVESFEEPFVRITVN